MGFAPDVGTEKMGSAALASLKGTRRPCEFPEATGHLPWLTQTLPGRCQVGPCSQQPLSLLADSLAQDMSYGTVPQQHGGSGPVPVSVPSCTMLLSSSRVPRFTKTYLAECSTKLELSCAMTRSRGAYCESSRAKCLCWGLWRCWKVEETLSHSQEGNVL